jgi:ABC-type sugar transport system ATPase subunit
MARIELKSLRKVFGKNIEAVKNLDFTIEEGEFVVIVGPSGCGKTTTLRMVAGFEEPTAGEIIIDGKVVNDVDPGDRGVGMVFQTHALFPHKTVAENIEFGPRMKKVPVETRKKRVREVADLVRIGHLLNKLPGQCSGGEAQRAALARTLITDPSAFLLDEPLSSLDAKLRREMRAEIDRLHEELKKTFVYVTHDQEEAMTLADRIVVMRDGHIDQVGTPLEIYHDPVNLFVADFFGSPPMNLLEGEIHRENGAPSFRAGEFIVHLSGSVPEVERPVTLGIRPEHMAVGDAGSAGDKDFSAKIVLVEPLGKDILLYLDYGSEKNLIAVVEGHRNFQTGAAVSVHLQQDRLYYFGADESRLRPAGAVRTAS